MAMKHIRFPLSEWTSVKHRLDALGDVYTTRVSIECGKYKSGDVVITPWGDTLIVDSVKRLHSVNEHPFLKELTTGQRRTISGYTEIDLVHLVVY